MGSLVQIKIPSGDKLYLLIDKRELCRLLTPLQLSFCHGYFKFMIELKLGCSIFGKAYSSSNIVIKNTDPVQKTKIAKNNWVEKRQFKDNATKLVVVRIT